MEAFDELNKLSPPNFDASPEEMYRWRMRVAICLGVIGAMQVVFIAFALGLFALIGFSGFARAIDVEQLNKSRDDIKKGIDDFKTDINKTIHDWNTSVFSVLLGDKLYDLRIEQCEAIARRDEMDMRRLAAIIAEKKQGYRIATKQEYPETSCDALVRR